MEDYRRVTSAYDAYRGASRQTGADLLFDPQDDLIAYFCLEFGFHESFSDLFRWPRDSRRRPLQKVASDVGLPFVAIGLLYQMGYLPQTIDGHGQQQGEPHPVPSARPAGGADPD